MRRKKPKPEKPKFTPECMTLWFDPRGDAGSPWIAACDHEFSTNGTRVYVNKGQRSDLASIPHRQMMIAAWLVSWLATAFFTPLVSLFIGLPIVLFVGWLVAPFGNHQRAALYHDAEYRQQPGTRYEADSHFYITMQADKVHWLRAFTYYLAVRAGARKAWEANRRLKESGNA